MSSIQCTWTREKLSDDQLVRVSLSFSFFGGGGDAPKYEFGQKLFSPLSVCFCIAPVCFILCAVQLLYASHDPITCTVC